MYLLHPTMNNLCYLMTDTYFIPAYKLKFWSYWLCLEDILKINDRLQT